MLRLVSDTAAVHSCTLNTYQRGEGWVRGESGGECSLLRQSLNSPCSLLRLSRPRHPTGPKRAQRNSERVPTLLFVALDCLQRRNQAFEVSRRRGGHLSRGNRPWPGHEALLQSGSRNGGE